ncbi:MAG TPA: DUF2071 domain-containing protein [Polyangiaceae bacterium]|nr:DUF2071 domain-containing protein [Polyangiaceae bacterium]
MASRRTEPADAADTGLERALLFNFAIHGVALVGMALLLLPMLPGGSGGAAAARIATIAQHPWRFRLGWLPWQLCAVADLWLALAMLRVRWLPRAGAWAVVLLTVIAVLPDQYAQLVWVTRGVELARTDAALYLRFEAEVFPLTAGWGALFYTLAALGWTYCFARAGTWSRLLSVLSVPLWSCMAVAVVSPLLPVAVRPSPSFVSTLNGAGFLLLQLWLGLVCEQVLLRRRAYEPYGRLARWRHPSSGITARTLEVFANGRLPRVFFGLLPSVAMQSEITDVVYVNYLVEAEKLAPLVPAGLELQRLGPDQSHALFTFLTYQHHDFGFAFLGKLRRVFPSPVQSNWRIHVRDPHSGRQGVYFVTNAISHLLPALGARLLTEGMPMHVLEHAEVTRSSQGELRVVLEPGTGSAPDAALTLRPQPGAPPWDGAWRACWPNFREFLAYCVPQDRALATQPLRRRTSRQEIQLGIPLSDCAPLEGSVSSRAARALIGDASPLCFGVPALNFAFDGELFDAWD